jgi:DNA polymerase-3 subunit delta'
MIMTAADESDSALPRRTATLFGHQAAEAALLDAYRGGRMAHAWLIGGLPGIGKATLAYRMARFVLAHPDPAAPEVQRAATLAIDPEHLVTRRMAVQAQGDLLVLERVINEDTGKLFTVIRVNDVRRTVSFFGSTSGAGGWRVCIVDSADELQDPQASNALLKVLEEPPPRALFLLVSSAPGRLLPTIRSRCRRLELRPLATADVARAVAAAVGRAPDDADVAGVAMAAEGSVARALALLSPAAMELRRSVVAVLDSLPRPDPKALHALGEALGRADQRGYQAFVDLVNAWLSERLRGGHSDPGRLNRIAEAWDAFNRAARDADTYNLDKKPLVFSVFGQLAEAAQS